MHPYKNASLLKQITYLQNIYIYCFIDWVSEANIYLSGKLTDLSLYVRMIVRLQLSNRWIRGLLWTELGLELYILILPNANTSVRLDSILVKFSIKSIKVLMTSWFIWWSSTGFARYYWFRKKNLSRRRIKPLVSLVTSFQQWKVFSLAKEKNKLKVTR